MKLEKSKIFVIAKKSIMVYLRKPETRYKILSFMGPTKQAKTSKLQLNL